MKTSTIGRIKKILKIPLIILFYLGVWQLLSIIVDSSLLLPSPVNTLQRLFELIQKNEGLYEEIINKTNENDFASLMVQLIDLNLPVSQIISLIKVLSEREDYFRRRGRK